MDELSNEMHTARFGDKSSMFQTVVEQTHTTKLYNPLALVDTKKSEELHITSIDIK